MSKTRTDEEMCSRYRKMRVNGKEVNVHRYVMEQTLGRPLELHEYVHHINGNRYDNRPDNLQLVTPKEHSVFHPVPCTPESLAKHRLSMLGKHWTVKTPRTQEYRDRISAQMMGNQYGKGHIHTPEHKAKIALSVHKSYIDGRHKLTGACKPKID